MGFWPILPTKHQIQSFVKISQREATRQQDATNQHTVTLARLVYFLCP